MPSPWASITSSEVNQLSDSEKANRARFDNRSKVEALIQARFPIAANNRPVRARLQHITSLTVHLSDAVKVCSSGEYDTCKEIWGLLGFALEGLSGDLTHIETVAGIYEDILNTVPRYSSYADVVPNHPTFKRVLPDYYREFLHLSVRVIDVFCRGQLNIIKRIKWKKELKPFNTTVRRLIKIRDSVIAEAAAFHREDDQELRRRMLGLSLQQTPTEQTPPAIVQPHLFTVPTRNKLYVAREGLMSQLANALGCEDSSFETELKSVLLYGLGGTGKSEAAIEFAHRHRHEYHSCLWIAADTPVKIAQGFTSIATKLGLTAADDAQMHLRVQDWLSEPNDPRHLQGYWPTAPSGSIIITSQERDLLHEGLVGAGILVEPFSVMEGEELLRTILQRFNRGIHQAQAKAIVQEVGGLPITIKTIGSYMVETNVGAEDLLVRYRDLLQGQRIDNWSVGTTIASRSLAGFKVTLDRLDPSSKFLLSVLALLDPDTIFPNLYDPSVQEDVFVPFFPTKDEYDLAFNRLQKYSLIGSYPANEDSASVTVRVHRQVRRHLFASQTSSDLSTAFSWIVKKLRKEFPHQSPFAEPLSRSWPQCESWISHLIALNEVAVAYRNKLPVSEGLAEVLVDGAIYLWERGLLAQGRDLILSARNICESGATDQLLLAEVYSFHGCILSDAGEIDKALFCFNQQVNIRRNQLHELKRQNVAASMWDEIKLANAYNNLAGILTAHRDFDKAGMYNDFSLQLKERWKHTVDLDYLLTLTYQNFANNLAQQEKWDVAAEWYDKALAIPEEKHYFPRRALLFHNYGHLRLQQSMLPEACTLLTEAVQLRTTNLGDHYDTANSLHLLACCYRKMDEPINASVTVNLGSPLTTVNCFDRDLLREAIKILEQPHLNDRRRIARSKFQLSLVLRQMNDPEGPQLALEAAQMRMDILGQALEDSVGEEDFDELVPYV
ncbi:hypothetical protein A1O3_09393 [Capronia epimyces CBS 606.96]|uniref:DUF7779 domain-containing protein n=1 Tax=Capronia epimyces CBS 606.96 TaxID=1182542 RepID=W9XCL4_9EURO|nr:uncharacterized protein A1O3_09393 [Capronia epimyces CBS 606.96]EXJ78232.1 hypothetical protein A1O3_09393 [Capronia epimyces CBS 606.96]